MREGGKDSSMRASVLDSLMVFGLVVTVGSVCVLVLLRDMERTWGALGGALEGIQGARKAGELPDAGRPGPSTSRR